MLLGLLDPSPDDTIDYVDGTKLVRCGSFFQSAVEGLYDVALCLQRNIKVSCVGRDWDHKSRV